MITITSKYTLQVIFFRGIYNQQKHSIALLVVLSELMNILLGNRNENEKMEYMR
jgi:hypothetical protein